MKNLIGFHGDEPFPRNGALNAKNGLGAGTVTGFVEGEFQAVGIVLTGWGAVIGGCEFDGCQRAGFQISRRKSIGSNVRAQYLPLIGGALDLANISDLVSYTDLTLPTTPNL